MLLLIYNSITNVVTYFQNTTNNWIQNVEYLFYNFFLMASLIMINWKRTKINQMTVIVHQSSTNSVKAKLRIYAIRLLVIYLMVSIIDCLYATRFVIKGGLSAISDKQMVKIWWTSDYNYGHRLLALVILLYNSSVRNQWMQLTTVPYCYFQYAIECIYQQKLTEILRKLIRSRNPKDVDMLVKQLILTKNSLDKMASDFDQLFRIFPLIWFIYLFTGSSAQFVYIRRRSSSLVEMLLEVLFVRVLFVRHRVYQTTAINDSTTN